MKRLMLCMMAVAGLAASAETVASPDGNIVVNVTVDTTGAPVYSIDYKGKHVILPSRLGFTADEAAFGGKVTMTPSAVTSFDETWSPVWGEYSTIRNNYNERSFAFSEAGDAKIDVTVRFRVFDDGVGFRYEVPSGGSVNYLTLRDEATEFHLDGDPTLYCIPGDYDTDEFLYTTAPLSQLGEKLPRPRHGESTLIDGLAVQTPLMLKNPANGLYFNIHEAALVGYPAMALDVDPEKRSLSAHLTPDKLGVRAYLQAPFHTPWRTVVVSDDARDILASNLILNLNEPCALEETSWIKPQKFIGVWWEMFTGREKTWAYSDAFDAKPGETDYTKIPSNGRHPANTANVMSYIDFAAESGIPAVLVEGWNEGWEDWGSYRKNRQFRFDRPYPDFDVDSLQAYAKKKGVSLIMHHETSANAADYERQLDRAFQYMVDHGYNSVKTGYVGKVIPRSEYHSSQWMVDHYAHVARRAADFHIMVDSHEAVRPTGLCRTYPNWVAQESARGGEYESMGTNPPEHTVILPFTRLMGGPMDYTPGLFENDLSTYGEGKTDRGGTTLTKQLALYLTMPSPLQMACDLPENYRRFADAFQFIKDVPVDWSDSRYLEAEPGDYITVARKDKNSEDWYVGGITDENAREAVVDFSFLPAGSSYVATVYEDAKDASWNGNPKAYNIRTLKVTPRTRLKQKLAPGGGFAIRLTPIAK